MIKQEHKKHGRTPSGKWRVSKWLEQTRLRAKAKGLPCKLVTNDIVIPDHCPLLGIPLFFTQGVMTANTPSIDRIDSNLGYVPGNIQVVSWEANRIKSDTTIERAEQLLEFYTKLVATMRK
jgi:hypothetical protein